MKHLGITLAALVSLSLAGRASALLIVDYAFDATNATLSITSPAVVSIPPQGTLEGQIRVTYSNNGTDIIDGPATLEILDMSSDLDIATSVLGQPVTVTGPVTASLEDPVAGTLTGNQLAFGGAMGTFHGAGTITCGGVVCSFANLPNGTPFPFDGSRSIVMPTLTVASLHGTISGLNFAGIAATLTFDAPETGREIPEPGTLLLLALGFAGIAVRRSAA